MKRNYFSTLSVTAMILSAAAGLLTFPREVSASVQEGLNLCASTLLPSLFPFFVLSSLVVKLDLARPLGCCLEPVMRRVFKLPGTCSAALVLGMIGGYPTGAKTAVSLYRDGLCTKPDAQRLLTFCNNCGPAFLFGAVGCGVFGHPQYGFLLAGVHYGAALLTGLMMNRCYPVPRAPSRSTPSASPTPLAAAFVESVTGSLHAILDLCSFVLCFSAINRLISISGLCDAISQFCFPFLPADLGNCFTLGLLEMTQGITAMRNGTLSSRLVLASALLGWGGLSVHCQVLALMRDTDLSPLPYLKGKMLHGAISALLMWGIRCGTIPVCAGAGLALLLFPCKAVKKRSGKICRRYCIIVATNKGSCAP